MLVHKGLFISLLRKEMKEERLLSTFVTTVKDRVMPWKNVTNSMDTLTDNHLDQKEEGMLIMLGMRWKTSLRFKLLQMQML